MFVCLFVFLAYNLFYGAIGFDICGLIYNLFSHSGLGHACHLGGTVFGYCFWKYFLLPTNPLVQRLYKQNQVQTQKQKQIK
jgi:membrane associated rhomboid family serine protease